jgi:Family of unknown function (DUF6150)
MAIIYKTQSTGDAHIRVAIVSERGKADLLVHRVANRGFANGAYLWFITRDKHEAQTWIYPCSEGMADLKVCFVALRSESGWVVPNHRLKARFG